jgi:hypothetical protein
MAQQRLYKDWCRVHNIFHVMAADIVTTDGSVYGLRITRPESEQPSASGIWIWGASCRISAVR